MSHAIDKKGLFQWRRQEFLLGGGGYSPDTWRARGARAYTAVWGQLGPGDRAPGGGQGAKPP